MTRKIPVAQAIAEGFTIDYHVFPWFAYKGSRFNPDVWCIALIPWDNEYVDNEENIVEVC